MYQIYGDGVLLYESGAESVERLVLSPTLEMDINKAGSMAMVLPPGNAMHGQLKKKKSIVTVWQDGALVFRGRVRDIEADFYNQQSVYCEGDRTFLDDSPVAPYSFTGTAAGLFAFLVDNHNARVESAKWFEAGQVTAAGSSSAVDIESEAWTYTADEIDDKLLGAFGGYLRTRTVGDVTYLDWVEHYGDVNAQPIEFGVNLLDLVNKSDTGDVFTCLIPLGASNIGEDGAYSAPLTIESVNGGANYIQNDDAVALYGRIWRTEVWSHVEDPAELKAKGEAYLQTGVELETQSIRAVDMHFVDGTAQPIRIGDRVRILSTPHGLDNVKVCAHVEIDLIEPQNTLYTFGERTRTLTENVARADEAVSERIGRRGGGGGGGKPVQDEINDIIRWAKIQVDEAMARINLHTGEIDKINGTVKQAGIDIDGLKAQVLTFAKKTTVEELTGRMVEAESSIAVNADQILAQSRVVDGLNSTTTQALLDINGLKADALIFTEAIDDINQMVTQAFIDINGLDSRILISTEAIDKLNNSVSQVFLDIDGMNKKIEGKVSQTTVNELTGRLETAETSIALTIKGLSTKVESNGVISAINQSAEEIVIQAPKVYLNDYVTVSNLNARIADLEGLWSDGISTNNISAQYAYLTNVQLINRTCKWASTTVVTGVNTTSIKDQYGQSHMVVTSVNTKTINYLSY